MESWVGPVYFVIFSYWGGPVPYLELFGGGPVKRNTLYMCFVFLPAKLAKVVTVTVHEVEGGQVDNKDEAGQQDEAQ